MGRERGEEGRGRGETGRFAGDARAVVPQKRGWRQSEGATRRRRISRGITRTPWRGGVCGRAEGCHSSWEESPGASGPEQGRERGTRRHRKIPTKPSLSGGGTKSRRCLRSHRYAPAAFASARLRGHHSPSRWQRASIRRLAPAFLRQRRICMRVRRAALHLAPNLHPPSVRRGPAVLLPALRASPIATHLRIDIARIAIIHASLVPF